MNIKKDCIFCKIISHVIPSKIIYEDDSVLAFNDINPQAPVHILVIPKLHVESVFDLSKDNIECLGNMVLAASKIAKDHSVDVSGFRLVINNGRNAGQAVSHLHLHLLGGRPMKWPPG